MLDKNGRMISLIRCSYGCVCSRLRWGLGGVDVQAGALLLCPALLVAHYDLALDFMAVVFFAGAAVSSLGLHQF